MTDTKSEDTETFTEPPEVPVSQGKKRSADDAIVLFDKESEAPPAKRPRYVLDKFEHNRREKTWGESYGFSVQLRVDEWTEHECKPDKCDCPNPEPLKCVEWDETSEYLKKYKVPFFSSVGAMANAMYKLARRHGISFTDEHLAFSSLELDCEPKIDAEAWAIDIKAAFFSDNYDDCSKSRLTMNMFDVSEKTWKEILIRAQPAN